MKYQVIIPAAGIGKRMGAGFNKLLLQLDGRPIILHTIDIFLHDPLCIKVVLVIHQDDQTFFEELSLNEKVQLVPGGSERQYSVYHGLKACEPAGVVLVHDGARPFIDKETIKRLTVKAYEHGAAIAAVPVKDTIKRVLQEEVLETIDRASLWQVQTPQAFRYSIIMKAHQQAKAAEFLGTDESSLVERLGMTVKIIESDYDNIKITTPEDLFFAKAILEKTAKSRYNGE